MGNPREEGRVIHNTAQPETINGLTLYPIRPSVRHIVTADFTRATPTDHTAFALAGQIAQQWPELADEYQDILASFAIEDADFLPEGGDVPSQKLCIDWMPGWVEINFPQVRFSRVDGKIYEKYQEFCKRNAIALSRSIENYMAKKVEDEKN